MAVANKDMATAEIAYASIGEVRKLGYVLVQLPQG